MADKKIRIGLFFGSFDPIHIGHLIIAEWLCNHTDITQIWFVISPQNPFKTHLKQTPEETRLRMLNLAIECYDEFKSCDIEMSMPQPNYTILTLNLLKSKYPEHDFVLIIGSDNLKEFDKWKDYNQILENYPVYVYPREGYSSENFIQHPAVRLVSAPRVEISSTYIRNSFALKTRVRFMLPQPVYDFIVQNKLYT
jgi:nicotinate-nucleotide adenylyltransferase